MVVTVNTISINTVVNGSYKGVVNTISINTVVNGSYKVSINTMVVIKG